MIHEIEQLVTTDSTLIESSYYDKKIKGYPKDNQCSILHNQKSELGETSASQMFYCQLKHLGQNASQVKPKHKPLFYSRSLSLNSLQSESSRENGHPYKKIPMLLTPYCTHSIHLDCIANFSDFVHTFDCPDCEDEKNDYKKLMYMLDPFKA